MKKRNFTIIISLVSILINAQIRNGEEFVVKVKPVSSIDNAEFCKTADGRKEAIVVEFDVVNQVDIEKFGNKIYAIAICEEIPSDALFSSKETYDLSISEIQYFCWNIKIYKEELLDQNRNKMKFRIRNLSRKVTIYCGPKKQ